MKILILKSSGNRHGSSNLLADAFIRGAEEAGHTITEYDLLRADLRPCLGCNHCGMAGPCVQKDDFENGLKELLRQTDMIVFVMPVYYYSWPAQLKTVVDRFYSFTGELTRMKKKTALLTVAWDNTDSAFDLVKAYYGRICAYMSFQDQGMVIGKGCGTPEMTRSSVFMKEAYQLGRSIK